MNHYQNLLTTIKKSFTLFGDGAYSKVWFTVQLKYMVQLSSCAQIFSNINARNYFNYKKH